MPIMTKTVINIRIKKSIKKLEKSFDELENRIHSLNDQKNENFLEYFLDDNYNIHLAFKEKDGDKEHVELLWAAVTSPSSKGSKYLHVGFERFLNTHPINSPTSLHYLYWHQQVLNNYDKNIELNYVDFLEAYHYPKIKTSDIVSSSTVSAPFESSAGSD